MLTCFQCVLNGVKYQCQCLYLQYQQILGYIVVQQSFTGCARLYSSVTWWTFWCPTTYSSHWRKALSLSLWCIACRFGASHKATHPRVAYIEDAVICFIICKPWTVSCLRCTIAMKKVLFFPLTTVCCWTPKCTPCNGEIRMCAPSENLNMCSCICCMQWLVCHFIACSQGSSMHVLL